MALNPENLAAEKLQDTDMPIDEKRRQEQEDKKNKKAEKASSAGSVQHTTGLDVFKESAAKTTGSGSTVKDKSTLQSRRIASESYTNSLARRGNPESANELKRNFEREASTRSTQADQFLDVNNNPQSISASGYASFDGKMVGLNNIVYSKPIKEELEDPNATGLEKYFNNLTQSRAMETYQRAFKPEQKHSFLYPSTDADGLPIMREFIGTREEFVKSGLKAYQTFGVAAEDDGAGDLVTGFGNSTLSLVDMALGAAKGGKDLYLMGMEKATWGDVSEHYRKKLEKKDLLDKIYEAAQGTTDESSIIASEAADQVGSAAWFSQGMGSVVGSQMAFMGAGGAIRAGAMGINAIAGAGRAGAGRVLNLAAQGAGRKLIAEEAMRSAAMYGASGIVNFGFAYNEATRAGLSDGEALAFGAAVGAINSLIETQLVGGALGSKLTGGKLKGAGGNSFDTWLANGGARNVTDDLLHTIRKQGGQINEEALEEASKAVMKKIKDRVNPVNMAEEALEEVLQSITEQGGKLAFNALYSDEDREKNKGKFDQDEIDFGAALQEGMFAAISTGGMRALSGRQKQTLMGYVAEGKADELRVGLDQLVDHGIDLQTRNRYRAMVDGLDHIYQTNKKVFEKVDGKFGAEIRGMVMHTMQLKTQTQSDIDIAKAALQAKQDEIAAAHADGSPVSKKEEAQLAPLKKRLENLTKTMQVVEEQLDKFSDPNKIREVEEVLMQRSEAMDERRAKDKTGELTRYAGPDTNLDSIVSRIRKDPAAVGFRNVAEAKAGLDALQSDTIADDVKADLTANLQVSAQQNPFYLSSEINTAANRQALLNLGIPLEQLPLTTDERALVKKEEDRIEQLRAEAQEKLNSPDLSDEERAALTEVANGNTPETQYNPEVAPLKARHFSGTDFQASIDTAGAQRGQVAQADPNLKAEYDKETEAQRKYKDLEFYLKNFGSELSPTQVHAMNSADQLQDYLPKAQYQALLKMIEATGKPISVVLQHVDQLDGGKPKGLFMSSKGLLVIQANLETLQKNKAEREALFAIATHELTHGAYDQYLQSIYGDYMKYLQGEKPTAEAMQFHRFLQLATATARAVGSERTLQDSYFMQQYDAAMGMNPDGTPSGRGLMNPDRKNNTALVFVREFFAEVNSDRALQAAMHRFRLDDQKNLEFVRQHYNFKQIAPGTSLLSEFYNTVKNFFTAVTSMLKSKDRTLLREAFDMAATMRTSKFEDSGLDLSDFRPFGTSAHEMSIAAYNPKSLLSEGDLHDIVPNIINGLQFVPEFLEAFGEQRQQEMEGRMNKFIQSVIEPSYTPNSVKLVFFQSSGTYLLNWKDADGKNKRQFFNAYGNQIQINTNVFSDKVSTMAKPVADKTFSGAYADSQNTFNRQVLNNLEIAKGEDFVGDITLEYDPDHKFMLNGVAHFGQVNVVYTSPGNGGMVIGFMPDLAKTRLSGLLHRGAVIEMEVDRSSMGKGSTFYVKRDANGTITHLINPKDRSQPAPAGYNKESGLSPALNLRYKHVSGIEQKAVEAQARADQDTFTTQDEAVEVDATLFDAYQEQEADEFTVSDDELMAQLEADGISHDISNYNLDALDDRKAQDRMKFTAEEAMARARRYAILLGVSDPVQMLGAMHSMLRTGSDSLAAIFPDEAEKFRFYGYEDEDKYRTWVTEFIDELTSSKEQLKNRQESADWDGTGVNPTNTISTRIKIDIGSLSYVDQDGNRQLITWPEAEYMLFESASRSRNFDEMMDNLQEYAENPESYGHTMSAVAAAIHAHWTKPMSGLEQRAMPNRNKSIWSQMASLIRMEAVTFIPNGDSMKWEANGKGMDLRDIVNRYSVAVANKIESIKQEAARQGITDPDAVYAYLDKQLGETKKGYFSNTKGEKSRLGQIGTFKTRATSDNTKALEADKSGDRFGARSLDSLDNNTYNLVAEDLMHVLDFLGVKDLPSGFLSRRKMRSDRLANEITKMVEEYRKSLQGRMGVAMDKYAASVAADPEAAALIQAERARMGEKLKAAVENYRVQQEKIQVKYKYTTLSFARNTKSSNDRTIEEGVHSAMELYAQLADFLLAEARKDIKGQKADYAVKELNVIAEKIHEIQGGYQTPRMFTDAAGNNRFGYKVKSYLDTLLQQFSLDKTGNGIIADYRRNEIYKNNIVLAQMVDKKSPFRPMMLMGMSSRTGGKGMDYTGANEMDFLYMHLSGFVGGSTKADGDKYLHIDDVPSDKPTIMAYRLNKLMQGQYAGAIDGIIETESLRYEIASRKFDEVFDMADDEVFYVKNTPKAKAAFSNLVEKVHYAPLYEQDEEGNDVKDEAGNKIQVQADGMLLYKKGWIFNTDNYFYGGKGTADILAEIQKETDASYAYYVGKGLDIPVSEEFYKLHSPEYRLSEQKRLQALARSRSEREGSSKGDNFQKAISDLEANMGALKEDYAKKKEEEQRKIFAAWRTNYIINRYWMSQVLMGDYMFYKQDEFSDLNKRKAGPAAPRQVGAYDREVGKVAILRDVDGGNTVYDVPMITLDEASGQYVVSNQKRAVKSNRTDAQGYMKEGFAAETQDAFGDFSEFGAPFKPVLFGVNKHAMEDARPSYYKLSLTVIPDPATPKGENFYKRQPELLDFATKFYDSDADMAIFDSAVKVGISGVSELTDGAYTTQPFDLNLFGLQNNPKHDVGEENRLNGMVQMEKILGDMGNFLSDQEKGFKGMVEYFAISTNILREQAHKLLDKDLGTLEQKVDFLKKALAKQNHTEKFVEALDMGMILENPAIATIMQNQFNSAFRQVMATPKKLGDKLVNQSDYGMSRSELSPEQREIMKQKGMDYVAEKKLELRWAGPRKMEELTIRQTAIIENRKRAGQQVVNEDGYIIDANGQLQIFGADMLVPATNGQYKVGDQIISVRIPTSSPSSIIPGEVVGLLPPEAGNVVITPGEGPGLLGFDFDVDGLFTWRKGAASEHEQVNKMFDIAYGILTHPKNFAQMTVAVSTDDLADLADTLESKLSKLEGSKRPKFDKFSPEKQIEKKELNSIGKQMISLFAYHYGVHSVLNQTGAALVPNESKGKRPFMKDARAYNLGDKNNSKLRSYPDSFIDSDGKVRFVFESFMQLLNAATDNAKLQLLGRLGITNETATVMVDMIAHGIPMEQAIYFINQPIIREYSEIASRQKGASYIGENDNVYNELFKKYEQRVAKERGADWTYYQADPKTGITNNPDAIYQKKWRVVGRDERIVAESKIDRTPVGLEKLKEALEAPKAFDSAADRDYMQLVILEKFKYYKSMAKVTGGAAALIGMASAFPKTYLEVVDKKHKIDDVLGVWEDGEWKGQKISIQGLVTDNPELLRNMVSHPQYVHQYWGLSKAQEFYQDMLIYAHPEVINSHMQIARDKPIEKQNKVMRDFYAWVLTQHPDLQTTTFNGNAMEAYDFVHQTGQAIAAAKDALPDNAFLRFLNVKPSKGTEQQHRERTTDPTYISFFGASPEGALLEKVHRDWDALPENFQYERETINLKKILLGHLAHTKGFALGAGFGTILPNHVRMSLDKTITEYSDNFRAASDPKYFDKVIREAMEDIDYKALTDFAASEQKKVDAAVAKWDADYKQTWLDFNAASESDEVTFDSPDNLPELKPYLLAEGVPAPLAAHVHQGNEYTAGFSDDMPLHLRMLDVAANNEELYDYLVDNIKMDQDSLIDAINFAADRKVRTDLGNFRRQALLHHQDLIPTLTEDMLKGARSGATMFDLEENTKVFGSVKYVFDGKGEVSEVQIIKNDHNIDSGKIIFMAQQNDVVKIKNQKTGLDEVWEVVESMDGEYVSLQPTDFKYNDKVKQYSRNYTFSYKPVEKPTAAEQEQAYVSNGVVILPGNRLDLSQIKRKTPLKMAFKHDPRKKQPMHRLHSMGYSTTYDAIEAGLRTATSRRPSMMPKFKKGELISIVSPDKADEMIVAKILHPPYAIQAMMDKLGPEAGAQKWSDLEGWDEKYLELNPRILEQDYQQVQYEYVATVRASDGAIAKLSEKYQVPDSDISAYNPVNNVSRNIAGQVLDVLDTAKPYDRKKENAFYKSLKKASKAAISFIREYLDSNKIQKATVADIRAGLMNRYVAPVTLDDVSQEDSAARNYGVLMNGQTVGEVVTAENEEERQVTALVMPEGTSEEALPQIVKAVLGDAAIRGQKRVIFQQTEGSPLVDVVKALRPDAKDADGFTTVELDAVHDIDISAYNSDPQRGFNYQFEDNHGLQYELEAVVAELFPTEAKEIINGTKDWFEFIPSGLPNAATGQAYTYGEFIYEKHDEFVKNKLRLQEIMAQVEDPALDFLSPNVTSERDLLKVYREIQAFGPLEKRWMGKVYAEIGNAVGDRMVAKQVELLKLRNAGIDSDAIQKQQADINAMQIRIQSMSDFGADQLAMQRMSRAISQTNLMYEAERNELNEELQLRLQAVRDKYFVMYPASKKKTLTETLLLRVKKLNEPYMFLFEKDLRTGEHTGRFIKKYRTVYNTRTKKATRKLTDEFKKIELRSRHNTPDGELAKAQIALYDFILDKSNGLMKDLKYEGKDLADRAFMPQNSMDAFEAWERNGKFAAYLRLFGPSINDKYDVIEVEHNGQTKRVKDWVDHYNNPNQSFQEKLAAPKHLKEIMRKARLSAINGTSGLSATELRHVVMDFNSAHELPFRSIARKKDFSINVAGMMSHHISTLVFKKHHDPLVGMMHAMRTHYQYKNQNDQEAFKNTIEYINLYADRYLFGNKDDMSKGLMGTILERAGASTAIMYLGANPVRSMLNATTGLYFSAQGKMANADTWAQGWDKTKVGYARMFREREKAIKIMNLYRVEMFTDLDVEREDNVIRQAEDKVMTLQRNSELLVRGTSFFSEMTQEQWDNFELITDPATGEKYLHAKDDSKKPKPREVKEWLYYINSQQGNYSAEDRRNYSSSSVLKTLMLFKGWLIDFMQERYRTRWIDKYGKEREGYVTTVAKMLWNNKWDLDKYRGGNLTKLQQEGLRKLMMDVALITAVMLLQAPFDDDDPYEKYVREKVGKFASEVYFWGNPLEWVSMAKNPMAILGPLEHLIKGLLELASLNPAKAGEHAFAVLPGHSIISDVADFVKLADKAADKVEKKVRSIEDDEEY